MTSVVLVNWNLEGI